MFSSSAVFAQDDLLGSLGEEKAPRVYERNAFKSTRVITAQSIEQLSKGVLFSDSSSLRTCKQWGV